MSRFRHDAQHDEIISHINITPFVDVVLVLLIVFMITAPMLNAGITIDVPKTEASTAKASDKPLIISIDKNRDIYVQSKKVLEKKLIAFLGRVAQRSKDTELFVKADRRLPYGDVLAVMGKLSAAGYAKITLVTEFLHERG